MTECDGVWRVAKGTQGMCESVCAEDYGIDSSGADKQAPSNGLELPLIRCSEGDPLCNDDMPYAWQP